MFMGSVLIILQKIVSTLLIFHEAERRYNPAEKESYMEANIGTGKRVAWTVLIFVIYVMSLNIYGVFAASVEAGAAVGQVNDSVIGYSLAQQMARGNLIPNIMLIGQLFALVFVWWKPLSRAFRSTAVVLLFVGISTMTTACMGPAKVLPLENVGPNETAFVIPMEGDSTKQAKFESVKFLEEHKVLSKRIELPVRERSTGRMWWDYEWIPTVRVIKVDRQLVTREWTKGGTTGTSKKDEALSVASLDSINFHLGVNMTASILEEEAPLYLYWHGQKPLAEVVDSNVRGYLQGIMADEFGKLTLEDAKHSKAEIFKKANELTISKFKAVGINISYVGAAQGLMFDDPAIQAKINETQTAEMGIEVAKKKNLEQTELNKAIVSKAVADREAAQEFAKAAEAQRSKIALDIQMVEAQAMLKAAEKWNGGMPASVLPQGSQLLFGLDKPKQ